MSTTSPIPPKDKTSNPEVVSDRPISIRTRPKGIGYISLSRITVVLFFVIAFAYAFDYYGPDLLSTIFQFLSRQMHPADRSKLTGNLELYGPFSLTPAVKVSLTLLGALVGAYLGNLVFNLGNHLAKRWEKMDIGDRVTAFVGVFTGLVVNVPIVSLFDSLKISTIYLPLLIIGLTIGFSSMAIYVLQSMADVLPWYKGTGSTRRTGIKILDTNIIIDGRIYDIARAGFLEGELYVPKFVLEELQYIADNHEALRRNRGRRGLEVLRNLQAEFTLEVGKYDKYAPDPKEPVDSRLVRIAKAIGADVITNDWNLNNVAKLQNVRILSLNELALTLRPNVLPGEPLHMTILKEGSQIGQGVGYLDDGTMVVVENGRDYIGETHDVTVTQVIQTERGKMIFAEVGEGSESESSPAPADPKRFKRK